MKKVFALPLALGALLAAAPVSDAAAQAPAPSPAPSAAPPPAAAPPPEPFVVYLTDEEEAQPAGAAAAALRPPKVGDPSPTTLAVLAAVFLLGAYLRFRFRPPTCPRCRNLVSRLRRSEEDTALLAAGGHQVSGTAPGAFACLACGEVARPIFLSWMTADRRCPQCSQPTKKVQLEHLERSGYLTWGVVRIDEDCLSCSYRSSQIYPAPLLEAPAVKRGLSRV